MPVPGWPELARRGASMLKPRTSRMASSSIGSIESSPLGGGPAPSSLEGRSAAAVRTVPEQQHGCREAVEHVAPTDGSELAGAEHTGGRQRPERLLDDRRVVIGVAEHGGAAPVA